MSTWRGRGIAIVITDTLEPEFGWHTPRLRSPLRRGCSKYFSGRLGLVVDREVGVSTGLLHLRNLVAPDHVRYSESCETKLIQCSVDYLFETLELREVPLGCRHGMDYSGEPWVAMIGGD